MGFLKLVSYFRSMGKYLSYTSVQKLSPNRYSLDNFLNFKCLKSLKLKQYLY